MSKLHEIINKYKSMGLSNSDIEDIAVEYAEWYATKCLEIAAETAVALERDYNDDWYVDKNSILNIELPSHD